MTVKDIQDVIDSLDDLLDQERRALLAGELDRIARLHEEKRGMIDELNALDVADQERLRSLGTKVERNQVLLTSAMEGIRAVAKRLADVRRVRESLETYDESGQKQAVQTKVDRSLEKRA